jgi:hypothetical protein
VLGRYFILSILCTCSEEDICTHEGRGNTGVEKTTQQGALCSVLLNKYYSSDLSMYEGEKHTAFWCENLKEGDHLEDPGINGKIILKLIFEKLDGRARTGSIWLRTGTGVGLLWIRR